MKTPKIKTYEFETPWEAMEHAAAIGWVAIYWEQKCRAVRQESADRLQAIGVKFSYICEQNDQIVLVPVN